METSLPPVSSAIQRAARVTIPGPARLAAETASASKIEPSISREWFASESIAARSMRAASTCSYQKKYATAMPSSEVAAAAGASAARAAA